MSIAAISDKGRVRELNEDAFFVPSIEENMQHMPLFIVADGMGGHQAGEVASAMAVATILSKATLKNGKEISVKNVVSWLRDANTAIHDAAMTDRTKRGMGTTLTMLYFMQHRVMLAHVGDSRAYRLRDQELKQLTNDHSLVWELHHAGIISDEEAKHHPYKNIITRALGSESDIQVDAHDLERKAGDVYLLCTDGLTGYIPDEELQQILLEEGDLQAKASKLTQLALERGGHDNITVILTDGEVRA